MLEVSKEHVQPTESSNRLFHSSIPHPNTVHPHRKPAADQVFFFFFSIHKRGLPLITVDKKAVSPDITKKKVI